MPSVTSTSASYVVAGQLPEAIGSALLKSKRPPPPRLVLDESAVESTSVPSSKLQTSLGSPFSMPSCLPTSLFDLSSLSAGSSSCQSSAPSTALFDEDFSNSDSDSLDRDEDDNAQYVYIPASSPFHCPPTRRLSHSLKFDVHSPDADRMSLACDALAVEDTLLSKFAAESSPRDLRKMAGHLYDGTFVLDTDFLRAVDVQTEGLCMESLKSSTSLELPLSPRDSPDVPLDWDDESDSNDESDQEISRQPRCSLTSLAPLSGELASLYAGLFPRRRSSMPCN